MSERTVVHHITAQIRAPSGDDPGQVTTGYYILEGDLVVMTDADGIPVRRDDQSRFERTLEQDASPRVITGIAAKLTREVRRSMLGLTETEEKFRRPVQYARNGLV